MTPFAGWMRHDWLPEREALSGVFTLGWKFLDDGAELWTERFSRFKQGDRMSLRGAAWVMRRAFPTLLEQLGADPSKTAIVCALGSGDTGINMTRPVPRLARKCAEWANVEFLSDAITKKAHRAIHDIPNGDAAARAAVLDAAEYTASAVPARTVIVFDDLVTRGGTLSKVAQAVLASQPRATVYGVAVGKHERRSYDASAINDGISPRWNQLWLAGEQAYCDRPTR